MNTAIIAVDSNIQPEENIRLVKEIIAKEMELLAESTWLWTKPIGFTDQPDFLNGAILVRTELRLEDLKDWLTAIEERLGRVRTKNRYGPRTMDLDIAVWNGRVLDDEVYHRDFLKSAIKELLPDLDL